MKKFIILVLFFAIYWLTNDKVALAAEQNSKTTSVIFAKYLSSDFSNPFRNIGTRSSTNNAVEISESSANDFFTPRGDAKVNSDANGNWNTIEINPLEIYKRGAVNLNTTVDMTKDFHFQWQIKIARRTVPDKWGTGDGLGFILHPLYKIGEHSRKDIRGGGMYTLPDIFGRNSQGIPVTSGTDTDAGQKISSLGLSGGQLGFNDLMNSMGFKIDTYYNVADFNEGKKNGWYGSNADAGKIDPSNQVPFGSFMNTDYTGYMYYPEGNTLNFLNQSDYDITDGQWWQMKLDYTVNGGTSLEKPQFKVSLNPVSASATNKKTMTWMRNLTDNELAVINSGKKDWAFSIAGSTGAAVEGNTIRRISGNFNAGEPIIMVHDVDENGTSLDEKSKYFIQSDWANSHSNNPNNFDYTNIQPTIVKDGVTYQRSQINQTIYEDNRNSTNRLSNSKIEVSNNGSDWSVDQIPFQGFKIISYVYRRVLPTNNSPITLKLSLSKNDHESTSDSNQRTTVDYGDRITLTYSATNNSGPSSWENVTAVQKVPTYFKLVGNNKDIKKIGNNLYIPLNKTINNNSNILKTGDTGKNSVTFTYQGWDPAQVIMNESNLLIRSGDEITEDYQAHIYDHSAQLIDESGSPVWGSYFYQGSNASAPLKVTSGDNTDVGNYVPVTNKVGVQADKWWNYANGKLTIYPHEIKRGSGATLTEDNWPWHKYRNDIKELEVQSGVTAENATAMFTKMPKLWKITLDPNVQFKTPNNDGMGVLSDAPGDNETFFPDNKDYVSQTKNWQEVISTGQDYLPKGGLYTATKLMQQYQGASTTKRTFVWQPSPSGILSLTVPSTLDFETHFLPFIGNSPHNLYSKEEQKFTVKDTRPPATWGLYPWKLQACASDLTTQSGGTQTIDKKYLYYQNSSLNSNVFLKQQQTSGSSQAITEWTYAPENGIYLRANSSMPIGIFKGLINYELINAVS